MWDAEVEVERILHGGASVKVSGGVGRASTLKGLDDLPRGGLGRDQVRCQTDLARATSMNSAADESQRLRLADFHDVGLGGGLKGIGTELAGKVTAIRRQWRVVEGVLAVGDWLAHDHMGVDDGDTQHGRSQQA